MGQAQSQPKTDELEVHAGPVLPHSELGFAVEMHADLVNDVGRRDAKGQPKWRLLRPNAQTLVLNDKYSMTRDEAAVHKLTFMYFVLKSEERIRDFFTFMDPESRARVAGEFADLLWTRCRDVFEQWQKQLDNIWCALPGLEHETAPRVRQWLKDRNQPSTGSPGELYARFCAFRTASLRPIPQILAWLDKMGIDYHDDASLAVKIYTAAHMRGGDLPPMPAGLTPSADPFEMIRSRLLQASNALYQDAAARKIILWPDDASAQQAALRWVKDPSRLSLFRSKNLPRSVLWDLLYNSGVRCLTPRTPTRVLDRVYREVVCHDVAPQLLQVCSKLSCPEDLRASIGDSKLRLVMFRDKVQDPLNYARNAFLQSAFQEQETPEEYLDKLLEYGTIWMLHAAHPYKLTEAQAANVARNAGCADKQELLSRVQEALNEVYLKSWLADRGIASEKLSFDEMMEKYRDLCMRCYLTPASNTVPQDCHDVLPPEIIQGFVQSLFTTRGSDSRDQEEKTRDPLIRALRLFTHDFNPEDSDDQMRLRKMANFLQVPLTSDEEVLASQVLSAILNRLSQNDNDKLVDLLLAQDSQNQRQFPTLTRKLRELSRRNKLKIDLFAKPDVVESLLTAQQKRERLIELGLRQMNDALTEEQARVASAELLDEYANRDLLMEIAKLHLSRPVAPDESAMSLFS
jgi:hypothetical protein